MSDRGNGSEDDEAEATGGDEADASDRIAGTDDPLAAVVAKPDAEAVMAALRDAGVYDDDRRVRERDGRTVELPVTDGPPADLPVLDVVRQADPEPRVRDLDALLRERDFSEAEIKAAPSSWAVVGDVVLVSFGDCERRAEVGEALLKLHGEADTVLARDGIRGEHREPDVEVVAGEGDTETVHVEHGTKYALDLAEVMFSPGNEAERVRMGDVVSPDERVLDVFAGVGYFALPMARAGADVTAVERNPAAFRYLLENAVLNGVEDRITPIRADCRDVVGPDAGPDAPTAERIVMGYYGVSEPRSEGGGTRSREAYDYLDAALAALEPGGVVHVHATVPDRLRWERPVSRLESAVRDAGRSVAALDRRTVKSYSEGVSHVVLDATVA